ncbi:hypothetical protein LZP85_14220 [Priestia flexa]|jgi:hypothetical protein|uniref:Lipoprotein n=1 Tax=Priestia flexa TaxID=86664 RepID=A0A8I1SLI2_9BACI|nr:hypothetical protein [Priestia flexa]MBN8250204.1 hypothetical protein [Priestia flexa]MBN8432974.1 hypothetical protein [Priestia flexa]MCA0965040.1 hypothetical protein [Priestia flexa]RIV15656.1 hypothetical protein D1859_00380 [Priestia flexa]UIR29116.1 hypothetical protein LZP85_14220 [Priestia flexa]
MRVILCLLACIFSLVGCQNDKPKPETNKEMVSFSGQAAMETIGTEKQLVVHQHVRGANVYVECIINGFSFNDGNGFLEVKVDGKAINPITQAAFVIKALPKGSHQITIELMKNEQESYDLKESFTIKIV